MSYQDAPPWQDIDIPAADMAPGPAKLREVIKQLDVVKSKRYQPGAGKTYCNIFVTDVCRAMGFAPGHWVNTSGDPDVQSTKNMELSANHLVEWLHHHGERYGWLPSERDAALDAAERGHLVIVAWKNPSGKSGHVAILLPEGTIAQAGKKNFVGYTIREGFGTLPVEYFIQLRGGSHQP